MTDLEAIATQLEAHDDYRVLRRLQPVITNPDVVIMMTPPEWFKAVVIDTETTGLDTSKAKVIELGIKQFWYDQDGNLMQALPAQSWYEDPGEPISQEITDVTGIMDHDVVGRKIPDDVVEAALEGALIIAHNADFDRRICERRFPWAERRPWACSQTEVPWRKHGASSAALTSIATHLRKFYDAHMALSDCEALTSILIEGGYFKELLVSARMPTGRVWAKDSAFSMKDVLKARGYRWHDGNVGMSKCWYSDLPAEEVDHEMLWLRNNKASSYPVTHALTAYNRYSDRSLQA